MATPVSLNRYAYAGNNPVSWTDRSGRCVDLRIVEGIIVLAVGGAVIAYSTAQWAAYGEANPELVDALSEQFDSFGTAARGLGIHATRQAEALSGWLLAEKKPRQTNYLGSWFRGRRVNPGARTRARLHPG